MAAYRSKGKGFGVKHLLLAPNPFFVILNFLKVPL